MNDATKGAITLGVVYLLGIITALVATHVEVGLR